MWLWSIQYNQFIYFTYLEITTRRMEFLKASIVLLMTVLLLSPQNVVSSRAKCSRRCVNQVAGCSFVDLSKDYGVKCGKMTDFETYHSCYRKCLRDASSVRITKNKEWSTLLLLRMNILFRRREMIVILMIFWKSSVIIFCFLRLRFPLCIRTRQFYKNRTLIELPWLEWAWWKSTGWFIFKVNLPITS